MAAAYPQALISQRTLFQLEVDYVQALESAWQNALGIRGFGLMDGLSAPNGAAGGIGPVHGERQSVRQRRSKRWRRWTGGGSMMSQVAS